MAAQTTVYTTSANDEISGRCYESQSSPGGATVTIQVGDAAVSFYASSIEQVERFAQMFGELGDQFSSIVLKTLRGEGS